jgi:ketosteroid isomerase-like protein
MTVMSKAKYLILPSAILALLLLPRVPASARQAAPAAADSAAIAAMIGQMQDKFMAALMTENTAVLDSLVASDAWAIRGNGERHAKADWLASIAGKFSLAKSATTKQTIHVHGNDVAVVVSEHTGAGTMHTGEAMKGNVAIGTIWVLRDNKWQIVLRNTTLKTGGAK